ncbi:MAG: hypothetical protein HUU37_01550 [Bdellovibrionales bacterium]|nr:hypothetical protein [Bdellovibrionales bacterium]
MTQDKKKEFEEKKRRESDRLAEVIEENQRRREQKAFLEELGKRISIARQGRLHFEKNELVDAVVQFRRFLNITARSLNCEVKDMHPRLFDEKNRVSESLLVSAICLDMAKIMDHMNTPEAVQERHMYFRLFVNFTVGMPFQFFVSENLRKYIQYSKVIRHKSEFQGSYDVIKKNRGCFVATVAFADSHHPAVLRLRRFRDERLHTSVPGRLVSAAYYRLGPCAARAIQNRPAARYATRRFLLWMSGKLA